MSTFFSRGELGTSAALLAAAIIGVFFGFWLERAGFGSARKLTAIFYRRDFAVLKVMFAAIVTAALGLRALVLSGHVDEALLYHMDTVLLPQIAGGLVFGVGFVAGGYCPGTAVVALAAGRLDAVVFLVGAMAGSLGFAALYDVLVPYLEVGACGVLGLPETLGLSKGLTTLALTVVALLAFALADRITVRDEKSPS